MKTYHLRYTLSPRVITRNKRFVILRNEDIGGRRRMTAAGVQRAAEVDWTLEAV